MTRKRKSNAEMEKAALIESNTREILLRVARDARSAIPLLERIALLSERVARKWDDVEMPEPGVWLCASCAVSSVMVSFWAINLHTLQKAEADRGPDEYKSCTICQKIRGTETESDGDTRE